MKVLIEILRPLQFFNDFAGRIGRYISVIALALMVFVILLQVFCRYVLNNALPWPDEAARFFMLWMVGLMAPVALRRGGFVAIDALSFALPARIANFLNLLLILIASVVVVIAVNIGWKEVTGFGGQFATAALYLPASMDFSEWFRIPRSWMMASILFGFSWMLLIQLELFARELYALIYGLRPRIDPMVEDSGC